MFKTYKGVIRKKIGKLNQIRCKIKKERQKEARKGEGEPQCASKVAKEWRNIPLLRATFKYGASLMLSFQLQLIYMSS